MIIHSQLTTPDGTVLVSKHRHDYVSHTDANGKYYFLDGGNEYIRSSINGDEDFFTVTTDTEHEVLRNYATWGTYGKSGEEPLQRIPIASLATEHIYAIMDYLSKEHHYIPILQNELSYREHLKTT